ncbi:MAG: magnesium transporter [Acidimicrobiia bacterium]
MSAEREVAPMTAAGSDVPQRETAADHVTTDVPVVEPGAPVGEVRVSLLGRRFTSARDVAVCVEGHLTGLVTIEDLLAADEGASVADVMDPEPPCVGPGVDQEVAAWELVHRGESSLAVVDEHGRFVGLVPPAAMLEVLLREHEEDLRRLGGFLHDTAKARLASNEPFGRRLAHRLPWLVVGLAGALISAVLLRGFESRLTDRVSLAFFIPGIVYVAGAVGTQTETLVVRGLSVGVSVRSIIRSELVTGTCVALVLTVVTFPFALAIAGEGSVAWTVVLAVFASCGTATVTGIALPRVLVAIGQDPAFGSGPLVTIVQDLLTIVVYLGLAVVLV